jgi:protein phosphatase 2C family protein 2/3
LILGARIAQYAGKHLHKFITKRPEYEENKISEALQLVI